MSEYQNPPIDDQYRRVVEKILKDGKLKGDPQGVGDLSIHGAQMSFDLSDGRYPLLGLRDMRGSRKAMAEEIFWIMSGSTNVGDLNKEGVHVWDIWAEATKKDFPKYPDGSLGPVYGQQWRAFNGGGPKPVDQLQEATMLLGQNPDSRRIVISSWNPYDINQVFIAPCLPFLQFHHAQGELGLTVIQRSGDIPIGVPFNIGEYALFLRMVAQVHSMRPALLDYHINDAHIYLDQVPYMEELIKRSSTPEPTLTITSNPENIFEFKRQDFKLEGYAPHPRMDDIPVAL